jgi:DNA-directed RNA polymerase II subunit RPB7
MVFFRKSMDRTINVHPQYLGPALRHRIRELLIAEVEGLSVDNAGFIITVLQIDEQRMTRGLIDHLTGFVRYNIGFTALMFRPFKNEVLDATVKAVSDVRAA